MSFKEWDYFNREKPSIQFKNFKDRVYGSTALKHNQELRKDIWNLAKFWAYEEYKRGQ